MIIHTNVNSLSLHRILKFKNLDIEKTAEKVASGLRINRANDDAAGLALSEKMIGQIHGLRQAERNAEDGLSLVQTGEGYLEEVSIVLRRLRTLAVQAANGIYSDNERVLIQAEVSQLVDEIDRIASQAEFNGIRILAGDLAHNNPRASMWFHLGANMHQKERVYIGTMTSRGLKIKERTGSIIIDVRTAENSNNSIGLLDDALERLIRQRAELGAAQRRLEEAARGIMNTHTNIQLASSLIRDADVAEEYVALTKDQLLSESGMRVLVNASTNPAAVLRVLRS